MHRLLQTLPLGQHLGRITPAGIANRAAKLLQPLFQAATAADGLLQYARAPTRTLVTGSRKDPLAGQLVLMEARHDLHQPQRAETALRKGVEAGFDANHRDDEQRIDMQFAADMLRGRETGSRARADTL